MALTHLADTSVFTRIHRPEVAEIVASLASEGRLGRSSMTDLEIGFSARNAREWDGLMTALGAFDVVDVAGRHLQRALQVQRTLAASGHRGRKVPDLIVAAVAEEHNVTILHYDSDFDLIAEATGQPTEWVVPRGTID